MATALTADVGSSGSSLGHSCIAMSALLFLNVVFRLSPSKKNFTILPYLGIKYRKSWKYFRSAKTALLTFVLPYTTQEQAPRLRAGGQHVCILLSLAFHTCYAVNGVNVTRLALLALVQPKISSCWREPLQLLLQGSFNSPFPCCSFTKWDWAES